MHVETQKVQDMTCMTPHPHPRVLLHTIQD